MKNRFDGSQKGGSHPYHKKSSGGRVLPSLFLCLLLSLTLLLSGCGTAAASTPVDVSLTAELETIASRNAEDEVAAVHEIETSRAEAAEEAARQAAEQAAKEAEEARLAAEEAAKEAKEEADRQAAEEAARQAEEAEKQAEEAARQAEEEAKEQATASATGPAVMIGDSRTADFYWYEYLPAERVYYLGMSIPYLEEKVTQAAMTYPCRAFFMNGQNDLDEYHGDANAFIVAYEAFIDKLLAISPGTEIFCNRIIPDAENAVAENPSRGAVEDFNAAISDMCARRGWHYVDTSAGFDASYYNADGIHFTYAWYKIWWENINAVCPF